MTTMTTTMKQTTALTGFGLRRNQPAPAPAPAPHKFDDELWRRLMAMDLDEPGVEMPISKRLAAENKWSEAETARAIQEYKRFVYMTQQSGYEVTPSRPVDLVWHEHLMHTKHYWNTMCRDVLRNELHHTPGSGGMVDGDRLQAQYQLTLTTYREVFREDPPADIWPRPSAPKSRVGSGLALIAALAGIVVGFVTGTTHLIFVSMFAAFVALVSYANAGTQKATADRGGCGSGCGGGAIGSSGCGDGGSSGDGGGGDGGGCGGGGD